MLLDNQPETFFKESYCLRCVGINVILLLEFIYVRTVQCSAVVFLYYFIQYFEYEKL